MKVSERVLEAFAVGDAMGMVTEFMTRRQIEDSFGFVDDLLEPKCSIIHQSLNRGQITDDTEQVIYLIQEYHKRRDFSQETVKSALIKWFDECDPSEKGYIGPSTKKAIECFRNNESFRPAGTTSGAPMRVLAPVLCNIDRNEKTLVQAIVDCVIPTHDTSLAIESSLALGLAYYYASKGAGVDEIISAAIHGGEIGTSLSKREFIGPSISERLKFVRTFSDTVSKDDYLKQLYYVFGTTMEAVDVAGAAIAIGAYCREDVWLSICMGASIGGDTDTIAAISGALSSFQTSVNNIPGRIVRTVRRVNNLDLKSFANLVEEMNTGRND